jgi:predicted nucleic acid-binding Zn ribbon protein
MFCIKCGTQLPDDNIFCTKCGTKVNLEENTPVKEPAEPVCSVCGMKYTAGDKFCTGCGNAFETETDTFDLGNKLYTCYSKDLLPSSNIRPENFTSGMSEYPIFFTDRYIGIKYGVDDEAWYTISYNQIYKIDKESGIFGNNIKIWIWWITDEGTNDLGIWGFNVEKKEELNIIYNLIMDQRKKHESL